MNAWERFLVWLGFGGNDDRTCQSAEPLKTNEARPPEKAAEERARGIDGFRERYGLTGGQEAHEAELGGLPSPDTGPRPTASGGGTEQGRSLGREVGGHER